MQPFIVNLNQLGSGLKKFSEVARKEFFDSFENEEILDANVKVDADIFIHGASADIKCHMAGTVTVRCDRCWDELVLPVETDFDEHYLPEDAELDFNQDVYDFICLALPFQRVHEDGQCNEEAIKYLCK